MKGPKRLPRTERKAYRRNDEYMNRIKHAPTWKRRIDAGEDYLKAALEAHPDLAEQASTEAALLLADLAREITFGTYEESRVLRSP